MVRYFCFWHLFLPIKWLLLSQYYTSFDFRWDFLSIFDGGSKASPMLENQYCGDSLPPSQISSSNQLFFHFHSNFIVTATGFKLEYNATSKNHYTLLGFGSEWPKDKALPLTMVHCCINCPQIPQVVTNVYCFYL